VPTIELPDRPAFTLGEVARLACIGESTVRRCLRRGDIEGYRLPGPGSRHRFTREAVLAFLRKMDHDTP
jgi:excisionase family DNA binding protein